ncbi:PREDICTED: uncharacterized protein LOC106315010 [Brassica oleracea var. oleracea]|uniref:uncharacterized protein LOC106315010 n=1 Tax=Brassica oleracea var. oleracea TaxID=109376 RepID=UPI0006A71C0A|nr:PREDICTED: uncharacterized protein LOC106315010 [Brassica oleracea var. oleracea]
MYYFVLGGNGLVLIDVANRKFLAEFLRALITYAREDQRSQEAHRLEFPLDSSIITIIGASTMEFLSSGKCSRELPSILPLKKSFLRLLLLRHTSAVASLNLRSENQINVLFLRRTLSFGNGRIFETNISLNGQAKACLVEIIRMLVMVVQILVVNWRELRSLRITDQAALLFLQRHLPPKIGDRLRITGDLIIFTLSSLTL